MSEDNISQDILSQLQDKYEKARKLLDEDSKTDPPTEPYRSKYKAQGILNEMKSILINYLDNVQGDDPRKVKLHAMLGIVWLCLGSTSLETEELSTGEEQLTKCVDILQDCSMHPNCIVIIINALNQLGILWAEREKATKSQGYLEKAETLYKDYVAQSNGQAPVATSDLFNMCKGEDGDKQLEKAHTHTLYYLAQVYGTTAQPLRSAVYCHNTLKRQLESKEYDPIDWALNAATLSQFFATHNGFKESRHHLAAASVILDQLEERMREHPEGNDEERDAKKETFRHRSADVARCWAKYGLNLLALSQARLMRLSSSSNEAGSLEDGGLELKTLAPEAGLDPEVVESLHFSSLELSNYETRVSARPANVFNEAREIFLDAKGWLKQAQEYYTMEHHASDAVEIIQDLSRLYQNLAFFEENDERQSCMYKRRADMLENALSEINPQYYMPTCRQLWFELAEVYSEMLELKKQKLRSSNEPPNPHALSKINTLASKGISHLQSFNKSVYAKGSTSMPEDIPEELARPVLLSFFYLGKFYRELINPEPTAQINNLEASIDSYKYLVSYCDSHEEIKTQMGAELGISREMLGLLPIKLRRLQMQPA